MGDSRINTLVGHTAAAYHVDLGGSLARTRLAHNSRGIAQLSLREDSFQPSDFAERARVELKTDTPGLTREP